VTTTSITTITTCPVSTTCTGQTVTFTGTEGPFPCSAHPTCTCVLPGGTQSATACPSSVKCTGQTTHWTANEGPTPCPASVTCNVILPSINTATSVTTTTPGKTGPSPTATPGAGGSTAGSGKNDVVIGGVVLGALLAIMGML